MSHLIEPPTHNAGVFVFHREKSVKNVFVLIYNLLLEIRVSKNICEQNGLLFLSYFTS